METYPTLNISSKNHIGEIEAFFERAGSEEGNEALRRIGQDTLEKFQAMYTYPFDEYLEYESLNVTGKSLSIEFVCSGEGLDFLARLIDIFGPYSEKISGDFYHDEEEDEEFDPSLSYVNGKVMMMGKEYEFLK